MNGEFDHLVVAALTLEEGVAWCEATLGIAPTAGGKHPLMGTHNRVISIASQAMPRAYLEIIAIDPEAAHPGRTRWFDLDSKLLQSLIAGGPRLIHWVLGCNDIDERCTRLRAAGVDRGEVLDAQRQTEHGLLRWRISVRADGARLLDGAMPTLIQWGEVHPTLALPDVGVRLEGLEVAGLPAAVSGECEASGVAFSKGVPSLNARLSTPLGIVQLNSL